MCLTMAQRIVLSSRNLRDAPRPMHLAAPAPSHRRRRSPPQTPGPIQPFEESLGLRCRQLWAEVGADRGRGRGPRGRGSGGRGTRRTGPWRARLTPRWPEVDKATAPGPRRTRPAADVGASKRSDCACLGGGRGSLPRLLGGLPRWPGGALGGTRWQGDTGSALGGTGGSVQLLGVLGERRHEVAGRITETLGWLYVAGRFVVDRRGVIVLGRHVVAR